MIEVLSGHQVVTNCLLISSSSHRNGHSPKQSTSSLPARKKLTILNNKFDKISVDIIKFCQKQRFLRIFTKCDLETFCGSISVSSGCIYILRHCPYYVNAVSHKMSCGRGNVFVMSVCVCVSVCLSVCLFGLNFWMSWLQFWYGVTSWPYLGQVWVSQSLGQGQGYLDISWTWFNLSEVKVIPRSNCKYLTLYWQVGGGPSTERHSSKLCDQYFCLFMKKNWRTILPYVLCHPDISIYEASHRSH